MSIHKLQSYIGSNARLAVLAEQVERLRELQCAWESVAPPGLAQAGKVGNLRDRTLVLYANNGAVAAKVRQLIPSILEKFQKKGLEVTAILVRVQARSMTPGSSPIKRLQLGGVAVESLRRLADGLEASPLRDVLEDLLRRHAADEKPGRGDSVRVAEAGPTGRVRPALRRED